MKKIWYSLRYGSAKTKRCIISVILLFILAAFCLIMLIATNESLWWLGTIFSIILAIIIMQSVSFHGTGKMVEQKKKKQKKKKEAEKEKLNPVGEEKKEKQEEEETKYLENMTQEDVEELLITYKVKKNHIPIMIDLWKSKKVKQSPAFLWRDKKNMYILTLEKKPRKYNIPLKELTSISYCPKIDANPAQDYPEFQKPSFAGITFGSLTPTYFETQINGRSETKKNLYKINPDLMLTNNCIRSVMSLLGLEIVVEDKVIKSNQISDYYKEGYKINLLWKDGVLTTQEYKARIKQIMQNMIEAEISYQVFIEYVNQFIQGRFITRDYAEYYIEQWKKLKPEI